MTSDEVSRRRWRRLYVIGPYLFIVLVGFLGFRSIETQAQDIKAEAEGRCQDRKDAREVLREVVDISTSGSGTATIDFTAVAGFDQLDPETQTYLVALGMALQSRTSTADNAGEPLHDRLLAKLPTIQC